MTLGELLDFCGMLIVFTFCICVGIAFAFGFIILVYDTVKDFKDVFNDLRKKK